MDEPLVFTTKNDQGKYKLLGWQKGGDHEYVSLVPVGKPARGNVFTATLEEVFPSDPEVPNFLAAMKTLRDFKRHELTRFRARDSDDVFESMVLDLDMLGCMSSEGSGPMEHKLQQKKATWKFVAKDGLNLGDVIESERDAKLCDLALENTIMAYQYVPHRHRTEALDLAYLTAKRAKRAADEEKVKSEAEAEAKAEKRRAAKKQKKSQ